MAALDETDDVQSSHLTAIPDLGSNTPKRHARVTVKYNRKALQRRLEVEEWIDESLEQLYSGQEADMPEEVNIDHLLDLPSDEERVQHLQELLQKCSNQTEAFVAELLKKLQGIHKQDELQGAGTEHRVIGHGHYHHEPYHFNKDHGVHPTHGHKQTL